MKVMNTCNYLLGTVAITCLGVLSLSCGSSRKAGELQRSHPGVPLSLLAQSDIPEVTYRAARRDTIKVEMDGKELILMKAIKDDETGEMVANEVIDAAVVTARFRNVAERRGRVDLGFQILVPKSLQDKDWRITLTPHMYFLGDSIVLDPVLFTGSEFRAEQMRGYRRFDRWSSSIVEDESVFVDARQLDGFLRRNLRPLYGFAEGEQLERYTRYGVSETDATAHFTNQTRLKRNRRKIATRNEVFAKYVRYPIQGEDVRLDSVITSVDGEVTYNYVQTISTRPNLRRVDVVLDGAIYDKDRKIYTIPESEPISFYISTLSSFVDMNMEHYVSRVIERRAKADVSYYIAFRQGRSDVVPELGVNAEQIDLVKENLVDLLQNEVYDLDSIVVVANASPEGSWNLNRELSRRRGDAVVRYFSDFVNQYEKSVREEVAFTVSEDGSVVHESVTFPHLDFISRVVPENWDMLDALVLDDPELSDTQKQLYFSLSSLDDKDLRERRMQSDSYYPYVRETLYPKLRVVDFSFMLHRKGMVRERIATTDLDSEYQRGVELLRDMKYKEAAKVLGPYQDYNTAVAYMGMERNVSAMLILQNITERTPQVDYLMAILYSRMGNEQDAVKYYLEACRKDASYVHRGNLDPEISSLIKLYGLNNDVYNEN